MPGPENPPITCRDDQVRSVVAMWGGSRRLNVLERLQVHFCQAQMQERFPGNAIRINDARDEGAFLLLTIEGKGWVQPKEFALSEDGSLSW